MSIWLGNKRLDGGSARNVGDIFYTKRKDSGLGGAVECNGGTYSTADYTGAGSIGELLAGGKLDYISLSEYATAISTKGWCDKIGWDGGTTVRVPTLTPHIIQKNNIPVVGNGMTLGMTNGTETVGLQHIGGVALAGVISTYAQPVGNPNTTPQCATNKSLGVTTDGANSGIIADTSDTAQLRVMFQLFNSTTDAAVATVGTVVADVAGLKDMSNVTATGKETVVGWVMPDYTAGVALSDITPSNPYTATVDCVLYGTAYNGTFFINGNIVAYADGTSFAFPVTIKLSKGDTITTTATRMSRIYMIPLKGVN